MITTPGAAAAPSQPYRAVDLLEQAWEQWVAVLQPSGTQTGPGSAGGGGPGGADGAFRAQASDTTAGQGAAPGAATATAPEGAQASGQETGGGDPRPSSGGQDASGQGSASQSAGAQDAGQPGTAPPDAPGQAAATQSGAGAPGASAAGGQPAGSGAAASAPGEASAQAGASAAGAAAVIPGIPPELRITGYAQADYLRADRSIDQLSNGTGEPLNEDRFYVRRARLRLAGDWVHAGFIAEAEFFANVATVQPTWFDVHAQLPGAEGEPPLVRLTAGSFPIPFTWESYVQGHAQRFFGERTMLAQAFVPGRYDVGAALSGRLWALDWIVAVQNGEPAGAGTYALRDPNAAKDIAARLAAKGNVTPRVRVSGGASALKGTGFSPGTQPTKDSFEWRDLDEDGRVLPAELIPIKGSAGRASKNFDRWGLGLDLQIAADMPVLGELTVYGEGALAVNLDRGVAPIDPVLLGRDQRSRGFYAAVTQEIFDYAMIGVRYDEYEPNVDNLELYDGRTVVARRKFQHLTGGVAGFIRVNERVSAKLLLEYVAQKNSLGRDAEGRPAQLDNDVLRVRAQVAF